MIIPRYAGIGSRETPDYEYKLQRSLSNILTELGYGLSSGGCPKGGDIASFQGAYQHKTFDKSNHRIYLSWNGMSELYHDPAIGIYDAQRFANYEEASAIGLATRGSWNGLGRGGIAHHTRNVYQILGDDLCTPVKFVLCWAIPVGKAGQVKGGTGTAVKLALSRGIPVWNLYHAEYRDRVEQLLLSIKLHRTRTPL